MTVALSGYQIEQTIYAGTRTLVYRGWRLCNNQPVVIKFLRNTYPSFSELVQFRNQYAIAKNLNIPGIVRPESLEPYGNSYALVMEDFGGISLRQYSQIHSLAVTEILAIAIELVQILHNLHANRVIHKDIKPDNILIHPETKQVKLIDFSIASLLPKETPEIKNPHGLEGTLGYLAPEQTGRMNRGIDYRSDFYALGVTLFELLAGQLPFESDDPMELVHSHIAKQPPNLTLFNIPEVLSDIVLKLMAKNAESRYQSALGLKHDLEICLSQLTATGKIESFEIGKRDASDRFLIPEKLYGRESEVKQLLEAFDRVSNGNTELMLVAGFSGIGKTAVVNEVHKPIARQRGYFIKGKYDQFQRNIPFSAFVQVFRDLMSQLLTESDAQIQAWKNRILEAVGENGQVIIEVIPELEIIIGKQPPATELSGTAAQNRFNLLFQKFTQVFTSAEHPLVMFLDDLQWADLASLKLIQLLMAETKHLFLIGAYRDNEVNPAHPLMLTLGEIQKTQVTINTITLAPLSQVQVNHLVADALKCTEDSAWTLSKLVSQKTQGNPFFATQFLKVLHQDGLIELNFELGCWECDITQGTQQAIADDVVVFMASQLRRLPQSTQNVLQLAACIGNQFDLTTLAIVSESSEIETATYLWNGLQSGLILPISDVYKFYQSDDSRKLEVEHESSSQQVAQYKFLHDRVQQAAYSSISENQNKSIHLKIGKLLLNNFPPTAREEKIFDIVNQLNMGIELIDDGNDRNELAALNLIAGSKAKNSTAYAAAVKYLAVGRSLLPENSWENSYDLTISLYVEAVEAEYLNTSFERSHQLSQIVLCQAKSLSDKFRVYEAQIQSYIAQNQMKAAVDIGLQVLEQLEITLEKELPNPGVILELANLPEINDCYKFAALRILCTIASAAYLASPELYPMVVFTMVHICIQNGNSAPASYAYACCSLICEVIGETELGYQYGQLSLQVLDRFHAKKFQAKVVMVYNACVRHWKEPSRLTLDPLLSTIQSGLSIGDIEYACYAAMYFCIYSFFIGENLKSVDNKYEHYIELMLKYKQEYQSHYSKIWRQLELNLQGLVEDRSLLIGSSINEDELLPVLLAANNVSSLFGIYFAKLVLNYLFGNQELALINAQEAEKYAAGVGSLMMIPQHNFYYSLALIAQCVNTDASNYQKYLNQVNSHQEQMKIWARDASTNYQNKYDLVAAEKERLLGNKFAAIELYDRAISGAKANGYIQEEALANELAAKFYLDWGKEKIAQAYMTEAYYCYSRWGAKAKVNDLEIRYSQLLGPILQQPKVSLDPLATLTIITNSSTQVSNTNISEALDFVSVIKAAQSLSSTIQLDELLDRLTQIILQNSGADKCILVLPQNENWQVRAISTPEATEICSKPLNDYANVPIKLIQYVKRIQTTVVIDNLQTDLPVIDDYLIQRQPKSVLCLPILNRGHLVGIIELKNQFTAGVFTKDRITVIQFLCSQAAIALENARLYHQSQQALIELQASESRFQKFADNLPGVIFRLCLAADGSTSIPYISSGCTKLYEVSPADFLNGVRNLREMEHPDDRDRIFQALVYATENLIPFKEEFRIVTPLGNVKWIQVASQQERQADGSTIWDGVILDVSYRKQAEFQLHRQAQADQLLSIIAQSINQSVRLDRVLEDCLELLQQFFQSDRVLICRFDADCNAVIHREVLSRPDLSLLGQTIVDPCFDREWAERYRQGYITACNDSQAPNITPCYAKLLAQMQVRANLCVGILGDDRIWGLIIVHHCHTTHVWQQSEIDLLKQLGLQIGIAHQKANLDTQLEAELLERRQAELALQQKSQALQQTLLDLQQTQLQMIQSEKMSALGNLVAGVAHEINNPVGFVSGNLHEIQQSIQDLVEHLNLYRDRAPETEIADHAEDIDLDYVIEDLPQMIDSMKQGCNRIKNISTSLRNFSRADTDRPVACNIHDGIDSTIMILKHRLKANEFRPEIAVIKDYGDLPLVECFAGQLNQVFMNLLANAIDALEDANPGKKYADIDNQIGIKTELSSDKKQVIIRIQDNGIGMSEQVCEKIFDDLFTTKGVGKGTGLGLAIARQIVVEKHGGDLDVQSELGQGTKFCICLPIQVE